jgi:hypothetical protein
MRDPAKRSMGWARSAIGGYLRWSAISMVSRVGFTVIVGGSGAFRTSSTAWGGFLYVSCEKPETVTTNNTIKLTVVRLNMMLSLSGAETVKESVCSYCVVCDVKKSRFIDEVAHRKLLMNNHQ